ncbi:FecR family protein [Dyadobacter aurulentus]|uniref:FecR family protein n=1 Tax=Dyadobacter sp. UC 10 TaxID=2605428 RepID=UPI0011F3240F|nr:FecR family protein [Dyadobacter sp. UC 10]KAA0991972.1 FecR family protein [Dyadobacter sp. UC 10]
MSKKNFYQLLDRYRAGNCTDQESRLVEQWFAMLDEEVPERSAEENKAIEERIWHSILANEDTGAEVPAYSFPLWKWAAAAVLVLGIGLAGYQVLLKKTLPVATIEKTLPDNLITYINKSTQPETVTLPDSSVLRLSPGTKISYRAGLAGKNREVYLAGRAFFDVFHDTGRPFLVHTGEVVTKVLGTSFWVEGSNNNSAIEVSVVTGKVSVSKKTNGEADLNSKVKDGVILTANQRVKYSHETHAFETGLVANPQPVASTAKGGSAPATFVFQDTHFIDVIEKLEKSFGVEIILGNDAMRECLFTADITQEPLFTKLDLLCAAVNATYEVRGTRILISGNGCAPTQ